MILDSCSLDPWIFLPANHQISGYGGTCRAAILGEKVSIGPVWLTHLITQSPNLCHCTLHIAQCERQNTGTSLIPGGCRRVAQHRALSTERRQIDHWRSTESLRLSCEWHLSRPNTNPRVQVRGRARGTLGPAPSTHPLTHGRAHRLSQCRRQWSWCASRPSHASLRSSARCSMLGVQC